MFDELKQFDQEFKPEVKNRPGIDTLPDGDYDFEITSSVLERTGKSKDLILRVGLKNLASGAVVENAYFFRTQQSVDILGADLVTLGFDADAWKPPARPFSQELVAAVPRMTGRRFRAKKVTKPNDRDPQKPFHNLYVNSLLSNTAAPAAYSPPAGQVVAAGFGVGDPDFPF